MGLEKKKNTMLKNRIITASILAPLIVLGVLYLPTMGFAVLWGVLIVIGAWEWSSLAGLDTSLKRLSFVAPCAALMLSASLWAGVALEWLPGIAASWWFLFSILLRRIPDKLLTFNYPTALKLLVGGLVLVSSWILMVWLRFNFGALQVLYLLLLVWLADIVAYFAGKRFGLTKLAAEISPGKTVAGLYGALLAGALFALAVGFYKQFDAVLIVDFVLISVVTVMISVVGDLFESLAKRIRGVKDSGTLLPGHGGILDRIDSMVAAVSVFYLGCYWREIFL